ncbi:hypothetical protein TWF696_006699 [Orbilia brochopaga]|uniref:Uncharacterized protein n=1 Tax=Orbilia brochopaga TaxID=3140254 RepID=A0AAV9UTB4_9PEZI
MLTSTLGSAVLPLALLSIRASAYTLWFYSDANCLSDAVLTHTINSTQVLDSGCEMIPADVRDSIITAYLALDSTDTNLNYAATLYSDARCAVVGASMPAETCADASFGVMSFDVSSSTTTFDFGTLGAAAYNPSNGGAVSTGPSSGTSNDTVMVDQVDLMSEIGSSGDVISVDLNGAGLPVGSTDPDDCTTVKEQVYNVDNDENGVADGRIHESAAIDELGNESYQKIEVDFASDLTGADAIMDGPVVAYNPTTNDPWAADVGLDGTSGAAPVVANNAQ